MPVIFSWAYLTVGDLGGAHWKTLNDLSSKALYERDHAKEALPGFGSQSEWLEIDCKLSLNLISQIDSGLNHSETFGNL